MIFDFDSNRLCLTEMDGGLVARFPELIEEDGERFVSWIDLTHDRMFPIRRVVKDTADRFVFDTKDGQRLTLRSMTMESYRSKVLPKLIGDPKLRSQADLERHFLIDTIAV